MATRGEVVGAPGANAASYAALLVTYLGPLRAQVALLAVLVLAGVGLQVLSPLLLGRFVDAISAAADLTLLEQLAGIFCAAAIGQEALAVGATVVGERLGWTAANALRLDLVRHCLGLDPSAFAEHTPGELIERVDGDVTAVASFFSQLVLQVVGNVLLLVGILVILWALDVRAGLALTVFAAVALLAMLRSRTLVVPHSTRFRQASATLYGFIEEHLAGLEDVRGSGAERYVLRRLRAHTDARLQAARRARLLSTIPWGVPVIFSALGMALAFVLAAVLVRAGELSLGQAFTLYYYIRLLSQPLSRISSQVDEAQRASAGLVRIQQLRGWRSQIHDPSRPVALPPGALPVSFTLVTFAYRPGEPALREVSFSVPAGQTLGVVGRTGSGKTTLTRLLVRLWDVQNGSVQVGGVDVRQVERAALRRRIGLVLQEPQLFHASLRDNLTLFDTRWDDAELTAALADLGLTEWVTHLPDGLGTLIGPDGRGLSAGEAQLVALGRVFLGSPDLVVLDEPSALLDPATERLVDRAMGRLLAGRTGLIVAHRLSTLHRADAILVLEDGRVVEHGPRVELAARPDTRFAALLRTGRKAATVPS